jgi:hypothetical protein
MTRESRIVFVVAVALIVFAGLASAGVVGSKHDLSFALTGSGQVCVFCHTPHQSQDDGTGTPVTTDPLWNHVVGSTASYNVYDSPTFDGSTTIAPFGSTDNNYSALCMSCHDGTVAVGAMYNPPNGMTANGLDAVFIGSFGANLDLGTDLSNDHPVNFTYDSTHPDIALGTLVDPATSPTVQSWLVGDTVQCSSCHDPHDDTKDPNVDFLNETVEASLLCTTCHIL